MTTIRKHSSLKLAALILLGLVLALVLLETLLQIGAWYVHATGREAPVLSAKGGYRILCLGDSNTYGLYLEKKDAYPEQLETLWNRSDHLPKSEVVNLGFPGMNSSRILRDFPRMLQTFLPDLVIVMVGVNDYWTVPVSVEPTQKGFGTSMKRLLWRYSRTYHLFCLLRARLQTAKVEVAFTNRSPGKSEAGIARRGNQEFELGWKKADPEKVGETFHLEANLCALSDRARDFGVKLILMTYPSHYKAYPEANRIIRQAAVRTRTPIIDLAEVFRPFCPQEACPKLFFPDQHPTAAGYRLIAETIIRMQGAEGAPGFVGAGAP